MTFKFVSIKKVLLEHNHTHLHLAMAAFVGEERS